MQKNIILHPRYFIKEVAPQAIKSAIKYVCPYSTAHIKRSEEGKDIALCPQKLIRRYPHITMLHNLLTVPRLNQTYDGVEIGINRVKIILSYKLSHRKYSRSKIEIEVAADKLHYSIKAIHSGI